MIMGIGPRFAGFCDKGIDKSTCSVYYLKLFKELLRKPGLSARK